MLNDVASSGTGSAPDPSTGASDDGKLLQKLRKHYDSYSSVKANEIEEIIKGWRYYAAEQWSPADLKKLRARRQPPITFDFISRKVNGIVGTVRRLRTDPKAFPRTETQDSGAGAELATQVVRYVLDASRFEDIETAAVRDCQIGIGVCEMTISQGDHGDPDIGLKYTDSKTFFYDPRSVREDFSDARYMGVAKWADKDEIKEIWPDAEGKLGSGGTIGSEYMTAMDAEHEKLWTDEKGRVRLVDHWYIEGGKWCWCLHIGSAVVAKGESPFFDENKKSLCKYFAMSYGVDPEGDRYGLVRSFFGPQDAVNQHRSKAVHIMNSRQIYARRGTFEDIEKTRIEAARPDGVIEFDGDRDAFSIESPAQEFLQQTQYYEDAKNFLESLGPNQALTGDLAKAASGRAYSMAQQAGLAEIGPFLQTYRRWKLGIYRAVWCAAARYWQEERWIRVTDDDKIAQFMRVNTLFDAQGNPQFDPMTGNPTLFNQLGALDVDILLDEGPDTETVQGDTNDVLQAIAQNGIPVPPDMIIEASNLPQSKKDKLLKSLEDSKQADPVVEAGKQAELAKTQAEVDKTNADAAQSAAKAEQIEMQTFGQLFAPVAPIGGPAEAMAPQPQPMAGPAGLPQGGIGVPAQAPPQMDPGAPPQMMPQPGMPQPMPPDAAPPPGVHPDELAEMMAQAMSMIGQGLQSLAAAQEHQAQAIAQAISHSAHVAAAPSEIIRDKKTNRVTGSRKVLTQ